MNETKLRPKAGRGSSGAPAGARDLRPILLSVLVHVLLVAVLVIGVDWSRRPTPPSGEGNIIEAVAIDETKVAAEVERLKRAEERKKTEAEAQRRAAEQQRRQEQQRLAELRSKKEREQQAAAALEREAALERDRLERLRKERDALAKQREEEQKRLAEVETQRKMAEEAQRKAEEERHRQEAERTLREQLALEQRQRDEERQQQLASLREKYILAIAAKVERNWLRPASAVPGLKCKVKVQQIPGGEVVAAAVSECNADAIVQRSVETAVYKSSPLPQPPDPALFDREIVFIFAPNE